MDKFVDDMLSYSLKSSNQWGEKSIHYSNNKASNNANYRPQKQRYGQW